MAPIDDAVERDVTEVRGDMRDSARRRELCDGANVLIHAAAALPIRGSRREIMSVNVDGTAALLAAARDAGVQRVVYISSTAVYGVPKVHPLREDAPLVGVGPYGESKIACERLVEASALETVIIRPKTFLGPERLGVFEILFDWIHDGRRIYVLGDGTNRYQLLAVDDLVDAVARACDADVAGEVFNVGATEFGTVRNDLEALIAHAGTSSRLRPVPARPAEVALRGLELARLSPLGQWHYKTASRDSFVDVSKAERLLGWRPDQVERRHARRELRLVRGQPRAHEGRRRDAPRPVEPAGARLAQEGLLTMLVLTRDEVEALLDLDALVDALADAFVDLSEGRASMPQRVAAFSGHGLLGTMPAYLPSAGILETKLVTLFEGNAGTELPTHQAAIAVFDPERGAMTALMDGTYITATRTAAGSALSARLLAREDARVLAVCGTGVQAGTHARAVSRVRSFEEIRFAGRDRAKAEALAAEVGGVAVDSFEEAVHGADVVCATTHSPDPVVRHAWLKPGRTSPRSASIPRAPSSSRSSSPTPRSSSSRAMRFSRRSPPARTTSAGSIPERLTELGEVLTGKQPGRTNAEQITVYKSVGVGVMDAAAAALVIARGRGAWSRREIEL